MSLSSSLEFDIVKEEMCGYCAFSLGRKLLGESAPAYNPLHIKRELNRCRQAMKALIMVGPAPFAGLSDQRDMLESAAKGRLLSSAQLVAELRVIEGIKGLYAYGKKLADEEYPELKDLINTLQVHEEVRRKLAATVDDDAQIKDTASNTLGQLRRHLRKADENIAEAAAKFAAAHARSVVDGVITSRYDRTVILIKASEKNSFGGMVYGDSASGQASYVEPAALVPLNNAKASLKEEEQLEIQNILRECSSLVGAIAKEETANLETAALMDGIFAKAAWGNDHDACCALLSTERKLVMLQARHPLIDAKKVVANDYRIIDPVRLLLISGPNTGGKTVSLKIIGLFTMMTFSGMPVPCQEAEIPLFDGIYCDIGDDQSVASSLSSFSAHIEKQAAILQNATEDSLVLIDEIGSGTDPREGEALAIAIINALREKKCLCVLTTHYERLKAYGKRHRDICLSSVEFDNENLEPTYRYREGMAGASNALEIACRHGLPAGVIKYARFLKKQAATEEDELIEQLEKQLAENRRMAQELNLRIKETEEKEAMLEKDKRRYENDRRRISEEAEKEAREFVEKKEKEAEEILKELRLSKETGAPYHEVLARRKKLSEVIKPQDEERTQEHVYKVGDTVELRSTGQVCRIEAIEKKEITVLLNDRRITVKKNQIRPSSRLYQPLKNKTGDIRISGTKDIFSAMSVECNLIGLHVDEAVDKLERYVDEAKLHGLKTFRVIHGDGSGALRKAVRESLAKDSDIKEFRPGGPGEGGSGATVVTLK